MLKIVHDTWLTTFLICVKCLQPYIVNCQLSWLIQCKRWKKSVQFGHINQLNQNLLSLKCLDPTAQNLTSRAWLKTDVSDIFGQSTVVDSQFPHLDSFCLFYFCCCCLFCLFVFWPKCQNYGCQIKSSQPFLMQKLLSWLILIVHNTGSNIWRLFFWKFCEFLRSSNTDTTKQFQKGCLEKSLQWLLINC